MPSIGFIRGLSQKLKTGNLRSIHLNAKPGKDGTRLDFTKLSTIDENLPSNFLDNLLKKPRFKFSISYQAAKLDQSDNEYQKQLNKLSKKLNGIYYQNNDNYQEYGVKTFGFGYPILIKRSKNDPEKIIKAPLIIWYLDIEKSNEKPNHWQIVREEHYPIALNEVLLSYLEQDEGIQIPPLNDEHQDDNLLYPEDLIQICNTRLDQLDALEEKPYYDYHIETFTDNNKIEQTTGKKAWLNWSGVFGLYRSQKESIIRDVERLLESYEQFDLENLPAESYQNSTIAGVETDPSQEKILKTLTDAKNKIIQGPPGTGKSQSLTAIITNALENGAKSLIVCEKKTALDVIYQNLESLGYGDLCAVIDDVTKDRKDVVKGVRNLAENIHQYRQSHNFREKDYQTSFEQYNCVTKDINKKHQNVLTKIFGDDTWKDVIGRYLTYLPNENQKLLIDNLDSRNFQFNDEEYNEIIENVQEGRRLFNQLNTIEHPLDNFSDTIFQGTFQNSVKVEITNNLQNWSEKIEEIITTFNNEFEKYRTTFSSNSQLNRFLIRLFAPVFARYHSIKAKREEIWDKLGALANEHRQYQYFSFEFYPTYPIRDLQELKPIMQNYQEVIHKLLANVEEFKPFFEWKSFYLSRPENQKEILSLLINHNIENWKTAVNSWYYYHVLLNNEDKLGDFNVDDSLHEQLERLETSLKQMQHDKIRHKWSQKQENAIERFKSESGNIKSLYNLQKNKQYGRKNSLRKIIRYDYELFTNAYPVLLVNPDVASSILPLKEGLFDLVLFDEASQLKLEEVYPAYIRGKHKVISGDIHQMPPSNYFGKELVPSDEQASEKEDEEVEDGPIDDSLELASSESLLEFAAESDFEKSYLDFHYRSRHPYLIDFSNAAFYGGRLTPMPERYSYKPIRFLQVNGAYQNRTNPAEANAVIRILFNHIPADGNGKYPSIGIATFNTNQRDLILEKIQDACYLDKGKNQKHEQLKAQGLFVKNLENIQGDERDIIILSTTFGLNEDGNFHQRFGPINQRNGYRLLNVIITRAKQKLFVCTSIPENYIDNFRKEITDNENSGRSIFYAYLAYAKAVEEEDDEKRTNILNLLKEYSQEQSPFLSNNAESPFENFVYDKLHSQVNEDRIERNYELGGFTIDFIIKSKNYEKPQIAIDCDGKSYHNSNVAYEEDLFRQKLIENHGIWYYRIWCTNWWFDPEEAFNDLMRFVERNDEAEKLKPKADGEVYQDETIPIEELEITGNQEKETASSEKIQPEIRGPKEDLITHDPADGNKKVVKPESIIKVKNIEQGQVLKLQFTDRKEQVDTNKDDHKVIDKDSLLAKALLDQAKGEKIKVDGMEVYYEILEINN